MVRWVAKEKGCGAESGVRWGFGSGGLLLLFSFVSVWPGQLRALCPGVLLTHGSGVSSHRRPAELDMEHRAQEADNWSSSWKIPCSQTGFPNLLLIPFCRLFLSFYGHL